jgi:hypothetical protein
MQKANQEMAKAEQLYLDRDINGAVEMMDRAQGLIRRQDRQ